MSPAEPPGVGMRGIGRHCRMLIAKPLFTYVSREAGKIQGRGPPLTTLPCVADLTLYIQSPQASVRDLPCGLETKAFTKVSDGLYVGCRKKRNQVKVLSVCPRHLDEQNHPVFRWLKNHFQNCRGKAATWMIPDWLVSIFLII